MKKVLSILIIFFIITSNFYVVNGSSSVFQRAKAFLQFGENKLESGEMQQSGDLTDFENLAGLFFGAGIAVIVIALAILGIKFMVSSSDGKAVVKNSMVPFIIGVIIIIGSVAIWRISITIFERILT